MTLTQAQTHIYMKRYTTFTWYYAHHNMLRCFLSERHHQSSFSLGNVLSKWAASVVETLQLGWGSVLSSASRCWKSAVSENLVRKQFLKGTSSKEAS